MILQRYLVVGKERNRKATARISIKQPALASCEIAIKLELNIPDELFTKPQLRAAINIPTGSVSAPMIEADVVDNITEIISKQLGVDLDISVINNS